MALFENHLVYKPFNMKPVYMTKPEFDNLFGGSVYPFGAYPFGHVPLRGCRQKIFTEGCVPNVATAGLS